jgi:PHP family Zn ribbon phosphoesterase
MSFYDKSFESRLVEHRCYECGRHWAVESLRSHEAICPVCAGEQVMAANRRVDVLERSNRSLKASAKKARGRYVELRQAVRDSLGATSMSALDSVAAKLRELV